MLLAMAETCYGEAKTYQREFYALRAAEQNWLGRHELMLTKKPDDIFWIDEVRDFYRTRSATPRFVVMLRDPRAVLTSVHAKYKGYYVSCERWRAIYDQYCYARTSPDVMTVKFEELVTTPAIVQETFSEFIGWRPEGSFERFHEAVPETFSAAPLNGVRPLDPFSVDRWRAPRHRERRREILRGIPELPEILIEMGYERDSQWVQSYT